MRTPGRAVLCLGPFDIDNAMAAAPPLLVGAPPLTALLGVGHLAARLLHAEAGVPAFPQAYAVALIARGDYRILNLRGRPPGAHAKPHPYGETRIDLRVAFLLAYGARGGAADPAAWAAASDEMADVLRQAGGRIRSFLERPLLRGMARPPLMSEACPASDLQDHPGIRRRLAGLRLVCAPVLLPEASRLASTDAQRIFAPRRVYDGYVFPTVVGYHVVGHLAKDVRRSVGADLSREACVAEPIFAPIALRGVRNAFQDADARFWWRPAYREPNEHLWEIYP